MKYEFRFFSFPLARYSHNIIQTFLKPFEIDEKVLQLMSNVEAVLRLVLEVDTKEAKDLTPIQRSLLCDLMRQANECILFIREYFKQSYCMMRPSLLCSSC